VVSINPLIVAFRSAKRTPCLFTAELDTQFPLPAQVEIAPEFPTFPSFHHPSLTLGWRNGVKPEYLLVSVGFQSLISFGGFALNREAPHQ